MANDRFPRDELPRRRGRPQQLPTDPTPLEGDDVGLSQRLSWLLATSRVLTTDPSLITREQFSQQLRARDLAVDSTRISRWESGSQLVRGNLVEAYEAVLGLPETSLVALATNLRRDAGIEPETTALDTDDDLVDDLFDRATHGTPTGADWLRLATHIAAYENFYLAPALRTTLSDKLVIELQLSVGHAQVARTAAAHLLMGNRTFRQQMALSLGAHILNDDAQVFRPAMLLLRYVHQDSIGALTLRLMSDQRRPQLARAASSVAAVKLSEGRYTDESLTAIERHILQSVGASMHSAQLIDVLDLVSRLPVQAFDRIMPRITDHRLRHRFEQVRATRELQPPELTRSVARDIARATQAATPAPFVQEPDLMLVRLVREALFHARYQRRQDAGQLLAASPYRSGIAGACLTLVGDPDPFVAERAWDLLHRIGPGEGIDPVDAALGESRRGPQIRALIAVGAASGRLSEHHAGEIGELAGHALPDVQHAATFALGMTGSVELDRLLAHPSAQRRQAAGWWRSVGPAVTT